MSDRDRLKWVLKELDDRTWPKDRIDAVNYMLQQIRAQLALPPDAPSPEDLAVLKACADAEITPSKVMKGRSEWVIINAELARREAKKAKT